MYPYNFQGSFVLLFILFFWSFAWKGYSLWLAAKHNHKSWFVVLLIINTVGILEIFYVMKIAKKSLKDIKHDIHKVLSLIK